MEDPIYNKLPDINFNYKSTIKRIHDIKYNGNNIFFLFSNNDVIFLLGYDNIDKKQLFLKSKTVDIDNLLTPVSIKISNNYVIIISENQLNTSKKILAKITIWEYIQDKSYCFQTDFYHMSKLDIFNNYIVLSASLGPTKANIIHIYNIIPFNGKNTEECNNMNTDEISNVVLNNHVTIDNTNYNAFNTTGIYNYASPYTGQQNVSIFRMTTDGNVLWTSENKNININVSGFPVNFVPGLAVYSTFMFGVYNVATSISPVIPSYINIFKLYYKIHKILNILYFFIHKRIY